MVKISPLPKPNLLYRDNDIPFKCVKFFYFMFHVILGLDFGFIKIKYFRSVPLKRLTDILSTSLRLFVCGWTIFEIWSVVAPSSSAFYSLCIIQYLVHVLILLRTKEETKLYNLFQQLRTIDLELNVRPASYKWEIKLLLTVIIFTLYQASLSITYNNSLPYLFFLCILVASDIVRVSYAFMFYAVNCRLKALGTLLKATNSDFLSKQHLYKSIVNIAVQHKEAFDPLLVIELLFNLPGVLISIYFTVTEIKDNRMMNLSFGIFAHYAFYFKLLALTAMPALCAGMLATQADNIKLILHDLLLQPKCVAEFGEIKRFIRYVEARGCRFRVYKLFPLDANLLLMILSFCVTYLIVIIQFIY